VSIFTLQSEVLLVTSPNLKNSYKISASSFSRESKVLLQAFPENEKTKIVMAQLTDSSMQIVVHISSLNAKQKKKEYLSILSARQYSLHCRKFSAGSMSCVKKG
jgi:hypothetical protein